MEFLFRLLNSKLKSVLDIPFPNALPCLSYSLPCTNLMNHTEDSEVWKKFSFSLSELNKITLFYSASIFELKS